ncbi:Cobalamin (vitamin B12)-binding domain [Moorella glycerini]|uniref:Methionine synthase n=1 Tax=Neomoorella stamsii TaxID=1266720 RepID=A0A9X7J253_9FIRM|nr:MULTISPECIES: cobalamin-dependent protein [Moorella]PRR71550.1 Methionine synthase [Moorella stamsii]CEP66583.1 Cobalamin (vitamin B12)-binding domain [Moorella glycerini]
MHKLLVSAVVKIDEDKALALVRHALERGLDPFSVLEDVRKGLEMVVELYSSGKYFLADLVMAAEIYKEAQRIVLGRRNDEVFQGPPEVVFGTVKKDIHDIGKNITIVTMRQFGIRVLDLGVDVPPEHFVDVLKETHAPILCLSGLISDAYDSMKNTVELMEKRLLPQKPVVVIGGLVNEEVCSYTRADYWVKTCIEGARLCQELLIGNMHNSWRWNKNGHG